MALASSDTRDTVLLDFDSACWCDGRLRELAGTPRFWSPERAADMLDSGSTYDGLLGDLFSMGISLLDVLAEVALESPDWAGGHKHCSAQKKLVAVMWRQCPYCRLS